MSTRGGCTITLLRKSTFLEKKIFFSLCDTLQITLFCGFQSTMEQLDHHKMIRRFRAKWVVSFFTIIALKYVVSFFAQNATTLQQKKSTRFNVIIVKNEIKYPLLKCKSKCPIQYVIQNCCHHVTQQSCFTIMVLHAFQELMCMCQKYDSKISRQIIGTI